MMSDRFTRRIVPYFIVARGPALARAGRFHSVLCTLACRVVVLLMVGIASAQAQENGNDVDPGIITMSPGPRLTKTDYQLFYAKWMRPSAKSDAMARAGGNLKERNDSIVWEVGDRMNAMLYMFDLTRDVRYLAHLKEMICLALRYRDDHHLTDGCKVDANEMRDTNLPRDVIRNKTGMPAWGSTSVNSGGLSRVGEVVSSVYAYPIAAFARIVLEDPTLHPAYGNDAMDFANAAMQTVWAFMPQMKYHQRGEYLEGHLTQLSEYKNMPSESQCNDAHRIAYNAVPRDHRNPPDPQFDAARKRYDQMLKNCLNLKKIAGAPMSHNENLAFSMVMIELQRALESPYYRQSPKSTANATPTRQLLPFVVARQQRYFLNRVKDQWNHADELPSSVGTHAEDTSHGALVMRYIELLRRDFVRLNAIAATRNEPIAPIRDLRDRFAAVFMKQIDKGDNLAENVVGRIASPVDKRNAECAGWLSLADIDARIYRVCHRVSLRTVGGAQSYLSTSGHAALLVTKKFRRE